MKKLLILSFFAFFFQAANLYATPIGIKAVDVEKAEKQHVIKKQKQGFFSKMKQRFLEKRIKKALKKKNKKGFFKRVGEKVYKIRNGKIAKKLKLDKKARADKSDLKAAWGIGFLLGIVLAANERAHSVRPVTSAPVMIA